MGRWQTKLSNGQTAEDYVIKAASTLTDKEIATKLHGLGFRTTAIAVRAMRVRRGTVKPQTNVSRTDKQFIHGDEWDFSLGRTPISSQEELLAEYKVDTRVWEVVEFNISRYEMTHGAQATGDSTNWSRDVDDWTIVPMNSIKAKLRKRPGMELAINEVETIKETIRRVAPKPTKIKRPKNLSGNMLELCIPDIHFGKVGWSPQTGYEDYDVSIARKIFSAAVPTLVSRVESYKMNQILFVVGNDVFHTDNTNNTTFAGTQLDSDTRYHRTFRIVREVMVETIDSLRSIAPVHVLVVPGNHDKMTSWHLGDSLECWFHKYNDVVIDNAPSSRKYFRWGNVFLLFTHGDKGKKQDYPTLMASERPIDWGQTIYREIHTGEKHHVHVEEKFGVRVRILSSLSGADAWSSDNMFVGALRQAEGFVWNKDEGLVGTSIYTYPGGATE